MIEVQQPDVEAIDTVLPQTQCQRCGYGDCRAYAEAIAAGEADINRCPPGGAEGVARLAAVTHRPASPIDPNCGTEGPRHVAYVVESACIGCARCIDACPVDAILGAAKQMHVVIEPLCTGCELCLPACPVDCIALELATPNLSGWAAWSSAQADAARTRYRSRSQRRSIEQERRSAKLSAAQQEATGSAVSAALARAREQRRS